MRPLLHDVQAAGAWQYRVQRGFSLVEMLLSLTLGAFVVLGASGVFLAGRETAALEDSLSRLQDNARISLDLLRRDLHRTGYLGCNTGKVLFVDMLANRGVPGEATALRAIRGYERLGSGEWAVAPPAVVEIEWSRAAASVTRGGARAGSDVLRLRTARPLRIPGGSILRAPVAAGDSHVALAANPDCAIRGNSQVVITGCVSSAHLFQVSNTPRCAGAGSGTTLEAGPPNVINAINAAYGFDAELLLAEEVVWFVGDTGRRRAGMTVWALFRQVRGDGRGAQEIADGVEHMQIQFRQRLETSAGNRIVDPREAFSLGEEAAAALDAVSVSLLLQGFERVRSAPDERVYRLLDERIVPAGAATSGQGGTHASGSVLREVVNMTVVQRNALAS